MRNQHLIVYPIGINIFPIGYSLLAIPYWLFPIGYSLLAASLLAHLRGLAQSHSQVVASAQIHQETFPHSPQGGIGIIGREIYWQYIDNLCPIGLITKQNSFLVPFRKIWQIFGSSGWTYGMSTPWCLLWVRFVFVFRCTRCFPTSFLFEAFAFAYLPKALSQFPSSKCWRSSSLRNISEKQESNRLHSMMVQGIARRE